MAALHLIPGLAALPDRHLRAASIPGSSNINSGTVIKRPLSSPYLHAATGCCSPPVTEARAPQSSSAHSSTPVSSFSPPRPAATAQLLQARPQPLITPITALEFRPLNARVARSSSVQSRALSGDAQFRLPVSGESVQADVEVLGANSRRVSASIVVPAPLLCVWSVLTDYYRLAEFVPSLARNEVLELREKGARLLQVGEQDVALGLKFQARVVVDVEEEPEELLPSQLNNSGAASSASAATPSGTPLAGLEQGGEVVTEVSSVAAVATALTTEDGAAWGLATEVFRQRAIRFTMKEGDFAAFVGRWVLTEAEPREEEQGGTRLAYSVDVTPHFWLPVALIESRIVREIGTNLSSVAAEACKRASYIL